MPVPVLIDLSHTSHTRARTGIQRVTRSLHAALGADGIAITHDPHRRIWRPLEPWERANLAADGAAPKRGARWPVAAQLRGRVQRVLGHAAPSLPEHGGLVVPEVFSPEVAAALPSLLAAVRGPRVALFHDAIALKLPDLTPTKTVARFPAYLVELLAFDGIAAVSEDSRTALLDYWQWLGVPAKPVRTIPLGIDSHPPSPPTTQPGPPVVLCVGSIEARKNHVALLDACARLWSDGRQFSLHLIGLAHPQTGAVALERIRALQAAGRPLRYDGPVSEAAINAAYAGCTFTIYPSLMEGFGLPIVESMVNGKPCICSDRGALGESARGGGCLLVSSVDAAALAAAIDRLLGAPAEVAALAAAARGRCFKSWRDYASELTHWMRELAASAPSSQPLRLH